MPDSSGVANPSPDDRIVVINLCANNFSGTTWLNLMLSSHPRAFGIGEYKSIVSEGKALCTIHGEACGFWSRFDFSGGENFFLQLHRLTGAKYLINNLMTSRKSLPEQDHPRIDSRFVYVMRDGRAVVASTLRKYPQVNAWSASRTWREGTRKIGKLLRRRRNTRPVRIYYEALVEDPAGELRRVCDGVGMPFDPTMLEYWKADHHYLWGNRGTLTAMLKEQGREIPKASLENFGNTSGPRWDTTRYQGLNPAQFKDAKWKRELTLAQRIAFAAVAGVANRRLGYRPDFEVTPKAQEDTKA